MQKWRSVDVFDRPTFLCLAITGMLSFFILHVTGPHESGEQVRRVRGGLIRAMKLIWIEACFERWATYASKRDALRDLRCSKHMSRTSGLAGLASCSCFIRLCACSIAIFIEVAHHDLCFPTTERKVAKEAIVSTAKPFVAADFGRDQSRSPDRLAARSNRRTGPVQPVGNREERSFFHSFG
jgi:hypothetical protein